MENKEVYKLVSENLTNLGGRMGTEYTYSNWEKYFDSLDKAKEYAEEEWKKVRIGTRHSEVDIKWTNKNNIFRSQDLNWVMYIITRIEIQ